MKTINILLLMMILMVSIVSATTMLSGDTDSVWITYSTPVNATITVTGNDTVYNCTILTTEHNGSGVWFTQTNSTTYVENNTKTEIQGNETFLDNNTGVFKRKVSCLGNSSEDPVAVSISKVFYVDTVHPTNVTIFNINDGLICVDATPQVHWNMTSELNFKFYNISFLSTDSESNKSVLWYTQNMSGVNNYINISLPADSKTYNLSIISEDLAGNKAGGQDVGSKLYTHNATGWDLNAGWNIYGIVRTNDVNLSTLATETGASTVAWYNNSGGSFVSYTSSTNAGFNLNRIGSVGDDSNNVVFLYMDSDSNWEGCARNFSTSEDYDSDIISNNTNNNWNIISAKKDLTFSAVNTSMNGAVEATLSYYNNTGEIFLSYFAGGPYNDGVVVPKGEALWIESTNNTDTGWTWTNQTTT